MNATEPERLLSGRYRLTAVIGRGGMGVVWQGHDELLDRDVAVKEIIWPPHLTEAEQQLACRRAIREAQMAGRLSHHNVVRIYDIVEEDGHPCIVMEFLPYRSLRELVEEDGPLSPSRAAEVGLGVLAALRAAHAEGILHRDVKPANVLVGPDGRVVLTDFGIARASDSPTLTGTGALLGSPAYIAPERARGGKDDGAAATGDLWGLGASLYAAVEGRPPFERNSALATLTAVVTDEPDEPVHAGPLTEVISGLLRKEPTERLDADAAERLLRQVVAAERLPAGVAATQADRAIDEEVAVSEGEGEPLAAGAALAAAESLPRSEDLDPEGTPPEQATLQGASLDGITSAGAVPGSVRHPADGEPAPAADSAPATGLLVAAVPAPGTRQSPQPGDVGPSEEPEPVGVAGFGGNRRRTSRGTLAALAALVAVAAGVTGGALYLTSSPGQPASAAGSPRPTASPATSAPATTPASPAASAAPGTGSPSGSPTRAPATATSPAGGTASAPATGSAGALPAGYYRFTNSTGFSIGVPDGWKISYQGHYVYLTDPANAGIYLLIDQSDNPKSDPLADWQQQEANREGTYQDYRRIRLTSVSYPQAEKAADWEFTYVKSGVLLHVLNRNVLANARHAYALYWATPESDWSTDYHYFQAFAATFRPAP